MPVVIIYLLKLSVSLAVVFLFYHFILQKLTFYNSNRWYLLGYTLLSFLIPFINISPVLEKNNWESNAAVNWVPVISDNTTANLPVETGSSFSAWNVMMILLGIGMTIMLFRLLIQLFSFWRLRNKATAITTEGMKLYQVDEDIIPFSFGNAIFINRHLHNENELEEIIRHEFVHVKQKHSLDILWGELLCLLNWYNPFAWLLKSSIRQNLEFIADNKVLENGFNKKQYQYLLLKVIGNNQFSIAPKFNFSSLKKRIAMMNKTKSTKRQLLRLLFLLPATAILLLAFRNKYAAIQHKTPGTTINVMQESLPSIKKDTLKIPDEISSINVMESKESNTSSDPLKKKMSGMVVVKRKDGGKEVYDLNKKESMDAFQKKYGVSLEDILPPPPPPPTAPIDGIPPLPPTPPTPPVKSTTTVAPVAAGSTGINLSGISSDYEITDKKAVIKLKDGTVEKYDLTNKQERSAFEKKYGKIIHVNTNVNTNVKTDVHTNVNTSVNTNVNANVDAVISIAPVATVTGVSRPLVAIATSPTGVAAPAAIRTTASGTNAVLATPRPVAGLAGVVDDYSYVITGKEDIVITITKKTTRQELEKFKTQMKEKGIDLSFDEIEYNDNGMLTGINGKMRSADGSQSNFVATDFEKLVLAMIKKGDKTYFKVSTKDNKEVI